MLRLPSSPTPTISQSIAMMSVRAVFLPVGIGFFGFVGSAWVERGRPVRSLAAAASRSSRLRFAFGFLPAPIFCGFRMGRC